MADILTQIVEQRQKDVQRLGANFGFELPEKRQRPVHNFLCDKGVILEIKRASPSKGDIAPELDASATARSYVQAGAAAISCLTESNYFKGKLGDLMAVCKAMDDFEKETGRKPPAVLRKDFLTSTEDIEIAYRAGADAVLLIARILENKTMIKMAKVAADYKMTSLVEVRSDDDWEKLSELVNDFTSDNKEDKTRYIVCGVNSRDLSNFKIDLLKPCSLLSKIKCILGENARVVFESGIRTPQAANFTGSLGFTGMLLGEAAAKNPEARSELVRAFLDAKKTQNAKFWNGGFSLSTKNRKPLIKICGLTQSEDLLYADSLGADFVGFIFAPGFARNVCGERFEKMIPALQKVKAKKVAVVTDLESAEAKDAIEYVEQGILDCLQFHGIPYQNVQKKLLSLPHYFVLTDKVQDLEAAAEELFLMGEPRFLQDIKSHNYSKKHKLWLAGGVTPENAKELIESFHPELIDVSSGVEETVGKKDYKKLDLLFSIRNSL